jgi:hypothetical protein
MLRLRGQCRGCELCVVVSAQRIIGNRLNIHQRSRVEALLGGQWLAPVPVGFPPITHTEVNDKHPIRQEGKKYQEKN